MSRANNQSMMSGAMAIIGALLLSGCAATVTLPEGRVVEAHEAFPDKASMVPPAGKRGAYERVILYAPYAVVYRAALASVTDAGMRLVSNDKQQGVILATLAVTRTAKVDTYPGSSQIFLYPGENNFFFAIRAREVGAKRTEVTIATKVQGVCTYDNPTGYMSAITLGTIAPAALIQKNACEKFSTLRWADGLEQRKDLLGHYLSSVRTKVIKAGYE